MFLFSLITVTLHIAVDQKAVVMGSPQGIAIKSDGSTQIYDHSSKVIWILYFLSGTFAFMRIGGPFPLCHYEIGSFSTFLACNFIFYVAGITQTHNLIV